jgi:hypothetical protein
MCIIRCFSLWLYGGLSAADASDKTKFQQELMEKKRAQETFNREFLTRKWFVVCVFICVSVLMEMVDDVLLEMGKF